jgi:hypothetical protein
MRPSKETLDEFMHLYEAEFNETLTEEEATEMWVRIMELYLVIYRKPVNPRAQPATTEEMTSHPA